MLVVVGAVRAAAAVVVAAKPGESASKRWGLNTEPSTKSTSHSSRSERTSIARQGPLWTLSIIPPFLLTQLRPPGDVTCLIVPRIPRALRAHITIPLVAPRPPAAIPRICLPSHHPSEIFIDIPRFFPASLPHVFSPHVSQFRLYCCTNRECRFPPAQDNSPSATNLLLAFVTTESVPEPICSTDCAILGWPIRTIAS